MKSGTRLDSAVFQLTPTRTRCDLIITANGKTEKMASGLLNPFLAHLKTARDQIAKGGYSVVLELEHGSNTSWFTKGTVERFVRFVSNPEVLERVYTIESEILQIEEAIAIQSNNDMGLSTVELPEQSVESFEGGKPVLDAHEEKAIVLYNPGGNQSEANGSSGKGENSKIQLLKVLETRKTVLQKEQGMAFARAVAAGFDIDQIAPLISFAESFGASRLMDACLRFKNLWTRKHETGQWVEIEAAAAVSSPPDFSSMNASGITLANVSNKQKEPTEGWRESNADLSPENNGKSSGNAGVDNKGPTDYPGPSSNQEYMQDQFPHPMYAPWPIHSPPGAVPVFQAYPMQGIPYYQSYPGNVPYFHPAYQSAEDLRTNAGQKMRHRRKSMDSRDSNTESETWDSDASKIRSRDGSELHEQISQGQEPNRKVGRSGKKRSGTVVIRNINYITSKKWNSSDSGESQSDSDSETDGDGELRDADAQMNNESLRSSKRRGSRTKSVDTSHSYDKDHMIHEKEAESGQWKAFQSYLLRDADEDKRVVDHAMFASEKEAQVNQRQIKAGDDLLLLGGQDDSEAQEGRISDFQTISGNLVRISKASKDEMFLSNKDRRSGEGKGSIDGQIQFPEVQGQGGVYRRVATDDFMIHGREDSPHLAGSSADPLAVGRIGSESAANKLDRISQTMGDESFIVPSRPGLPAQRGTGYRAAIDIDSEVPSLLQKEEEAPNRGTQVIYEPNDLSLVPERGAEKSSIGYDPAFDYEMQVHADTAMINKNKEDVTKPNGSKNLDRSQRPKATPNASDKKLLGAKKGKPSKLSPLDEARARAERLRSFKADLQKVKKEKEEEAIKRLEALKQERQKRIAARSGSNLSSSLSPSEHAKKQLPTKRSPGLQRVSKFSDSETGSSSPLHRAPKRNLSLELSKSPITPKPVSSKSGSHLAGNRLTRSASSLPEPKKENKSIATDPKATMARIRRLSEPKTRTNHDVPKPKAKPSDGHEKKKISAIINLDKTKAATLPELKIRTPKGPPDEMQSVPAAMEMTQKVNGTSEISNVDGKNSMFNHNDMDDNPIIEKTVVMLECQKPAAPTIHALNKMAGALKGHYDNHTPGGKTEIVSEYTPIRAPISEFKMGGVDIEPVDHQVLELPSSFEESTMYTEKETPKFSSIPNDERPYQAPFARVSSIEDPCTRNSEYGKAPSNAEMPITRTDSVKPLISDFKNLKLEKIQEASERSQVKDSPKGFRRLLKLGRKNHSSAAGGHLSESDNVSITGSVAGDNALNAAAASSEVHMLKNLISQDETPGASTAQKSSGSFSLLAPFRSKNNEKRLTT